MKKLFQYLIVFSAGVVHDTNAQLVTVTDSLTNEPIFLAHVFIEGTSHGVVFNEDGEVNLSSFSDTDGITFSHIAYKKFQVKKPSITPIIPN